MQRCVGCPRDSPETPAETPGSSTGLARPEVVDPAITREQAAGPAWPARRKFTNRRVDIEGHPWRRVRGLGMSEAAAGHAGLAAVTADLVERLRSGKLRAFLTLRDRLGMRSCIVSPKPGLDFGRRG